MKKYSKAALCAKTIREELKQKYPNIKFSVTSRNFYTGGSSIDVKYTDSDVFESEINKLLSKYQIGKYNASFDMYEITNERTDIPQVDYLVVTREMSEQAHSIIIDMITKKYSVDKNDLIENRYIKELNRSAYELIWQEFDYTKF